MIDVNKIVNKNVNIINTTNIMNILNSECNKIYSIKCEYNKYA